MPHSLLNLLTRVSVGTLSYVAVITGVYESIYVLEQLKISVAEKAIYQQYQMFISVLIHDVKAPLRFLADVTDSIYSDWDNILEKDKRVYSLEVKNAILDLSNFVGNYLTWLKVVQEKNVERDKVNLKRLLLKVVRMHELKSTILNNNIVVEGSDDIYIESNEIILERIINNLTDYALKNTKNGTISFSTKLEVGNIVLLCSFTGNGMERHQLADLREFYSNGVTGYVSSFHMTHLFLRDFVNAINAEIFIDSEIGKGTTTKLKFKTDEISNRLF